MLWLVCGKSIHLHYCCVIIYSKCTQHINLFCSNWKVFLLNTQAKITMAFWSVVTHNVWFYINLFNCSFFLRNSFSEASTLQYMYFYENKKK